MLMSEALSNYRGSANTAAMVLGEITKRWPAEASQYDPFQNCLPFRKWSELGFKVKKGEKSIRSITYIEKKDENGNTLRSYPRTVHLFYKTQVEPIA